MKSFDVKHKPDKCKKKFFFQNSVIGMVLSFILRTILVSCIYNRGGTARELELSYNNIEAEKISCEHGILKNLKFVQQPAYFL